VVNSASQIVKISPLDGLVSPTGGVSLREKPFVGKVNLRGDVETGDFGSIVESVLGGFVPTTPNTVVTSRDFTIFWLGPDEWLIHTPEDGQGDLIARLRAALGDIHSAVTDVSDYFVVIEMRGRHCRDVLARGCSLDLHPRSFGAGGCAQTHFSHANVLLHQINDTDFDIQVRWTYAQYLWGYLSEAASNVAA
jgi:sarcosine oxidase, subunit gamma